MKKLIILLACLLLLCGCQNKKGIKVTDGDTSIIEIAGSKFTKEDLFNQMKGISGADTTLVALKLKLAELEKIDLSELEKEASDYVDYIASYGEDYVEYYGGEDVIKYSYMASSIDSAFVKEYVTRHLDEYVTDYKPFYAQYVSFEDDETANKLIEAIKEGSTFDMAAADLGIQDDPSLHVYTERDTLPEEIKEYCLSLTEPVLSNVIKGATEGTDEEGNAITTDIYYVVNVPTCDINDYKEEFAQHLADYGYVDASIPLNDMFKAHTINIYDEDIYNALSQTYGALAR